MYQFSVSEGAAIGTSVGRVIATDADMGENTDMSYLIKDEEGGELFRVSTDGDTQEAVITIKKVDLRSTRLSVLWLIFYTYLSKGLRLWVSDDLDVLSMKQTFCLSVCSSNLQDMTERTLFSLKLYFSLFHYILQPLDFEKKRTHNVVVEAVNKHVDPRFVDLGSFRDQTIVRVSVSDTDEPPIFFPPTGAIMEVQEDAKQGALVGIVTAKDPDMDNVPVR